jgi:hypothetical protein
MIGARAVILVPCPRLEQIWNSPPFELRIWEAAGYVFESQIPPTW